MHSHVGLNTLIAHADMCGENMMGRPAPPRCERALRAEGEVLRSAVRAAFLQIPLGDQAQYYVVGFVILNLHLLIQHPHRVVLRAGQITQ